MRGSHASPGMLSSRIVRLFVLDCYQQSTITRYCPLGGEKKYRAIVTRCVVSCSKMLRSEEKLNRAFSDVFIFVFIYSLIFCLLRYRLLTGICTISFVGVILQLASVTIFIIRFLLLQRNSSNCFRTTAISMIATSKYEISYGAISTIDILLSVLKVAFLYILYTSFIIHSFLLHH